MPSVELGPDAHEDGEPRSQGSFPSVLVSWQQHGHETTRKYTHTQTHTHTHTHTTHRGVTKAAPK